MAEELSSRLSSDGVPSAVSPSTLPLADPWQSENLPSVSSPDLSGPEINTVETVDADQDDILEDDKLSQQEKSVKLQKLLFLAASNGDVTKVHSLLGGDASKYLSLDAKDDSGSTALIYSSCFGNEAIVSELLRFGANPDIQDSQEWTALMWAINNHNMAIVKALMENGASLELRTSSGRSALDFITPNSEISTYMKQNGYIDSEEPKDFYDDGADPNQSTAAASEQMFSHDYSEESASAALGIQVSMSKLDLNESPQPNFDDDDDYDVDLNDHEEFVWERCLPDQMFVFNEGDIPKILDLSITKMQPIRSRSQKPVPANIVFLSARYAHYYGNPETLEIFLEPIIARIRAVVTANDRDMSFLGFWLSNCCLLLYYLRKDPGLMAVTTNFQEQLSELISDIYILITQDAELRIEKVVDSSILDYETIPGLNNIAYQTDWNIFRHKAKPMSHKEEVDQVIKPPSPKRKAKPSPRNVTSILSAVLFVMDLYGVHPIITQQIISQVFYWLGAVLFNRIMTNRTYLARSRAMQIRLNISALEDWARSNNRRPESVNEFEENHYSSIVEICRNHFESLVQLLQWLQCFTGFGDDFTNVVATLQQLTKLNPLQLLHVANKYRPEVGEKGLSKPYKQYLAQMSKHYQHRRVHHATVDKVREDKSAKAKSDSHRTHEKQDNSSEKEKATGSVSSNKEVAGSNNDMQQQQQMKASDSSEAKSDVSISNINKDSSNDNKKEINSTNEASSNSTSPISPVAPSVTAVKSPVKSTIVRKQEHDEDNKGDVYLDASLVLPFTIPTLREMIVSYGAGLGGTNIKRARRYEPTLPNEFLDQFETENEENAATNNTVNPIFRDLTVPEPSVHKAWGEDPELDAMNGGW